MPPLTRTALLSGLAAFLLALVFFKPGAPILARAPAAALGSVLLSPEDPLAQRTLLLDESLAFLPQFSAPQSASAESQFNVEGTPFSRFPPRLRFEIGRRPDLPYETDFSKFYAPLDAFDPLKGEPFLSFSSTNTPLSSIKPRAFRCVVTPLGQTALPIFTIEVGEFPNFNSSKTGFFEIKALIGVDSLGIVGKPTIIQTSGDASLDLALVDWIAAQPWERKISPGVFQVSVGP